MPFDSLSELRALQGQFFMGTVVVTPAAGQFAHAQIKNPAASGIIAYVYTITLNNQGSNTNHFLYRDGTDLTTLDNNGLNNLDGSAGTCQLRRESNAGIKPAIGLRFASGGRPVRDFAVFDFPAPIVLPSGVGIIILSGDADVVINPTFVWREE